jgi:transcriptional regulator with XRE-family HTH domain
VDDQRVGRVVRVLWIRLGWRQVDLADRAGVSQGAISLVERGHVDRLSIRTLRHILAAVDAGAELLVRWRAGELDRVLDEGHARLVASIARRLTGYGWLVVPEVSYSRYGERGSIDVLAWHAETRTLLVVEVKTELTSIEATLRKHDEKVRLAPAIASEQFGWSPQSVSRLLVLPSASTPRRRVKAHAALFDQVYPARDERLRAWLRRPRGGGNGVLFIAAADASARRTVKRVRYRT